MAARAAGGLDGCSMIDGYTVLTATKRSSTEMVLTLCNSRSCAT